MDSRCQLSLREVRLIYLITYSQVDSSIAATREDFARIVVDAFSKTNSGSSEIIKASGFVVEKTIHYHKAVKLTRARRWASIRNYLQREYGICVNFSNVREHKLFRCLAQCHKGGQFLHRVHGHPELTNDSQPRTTNATVQDFSHHLFFNVSHIHN